jgi:hypothetical protein
LCQYRFGRKNFSQLAEKKQSVRIAYFTVTGWQGEGRGEALRAKGVALLNQVWVTPKTPEGIH